MKTTNLEISKKLKEIGFKAETHLYYHFAFGCLNLTCHTREEAARYAKELGHIPCFDLETLLEAMPTCIKLKKKLYYLWLGGKGIGYYPEVNSDRYCGGNIVYDMDDPILISFNNDYKKWDESSDESLADTAGRLIIELHEKGLIKFGGENE